ncbi:MAG: hypothetical protein JNL57_10540 [Bacteroidetes bacterium]|nr:hypothetical protein [Bacteroidota bacterium]
MRPFFICLGVSALLAACGGNPSVPGKAKKSDTTVKADNYPHDRKYNDMARYLAGFKTRDGSVMLGQDTGRFFSEHTTRFGTQWDEMEQKRLSVMRKWAKEEIHTKVDPAKNTFYPFSGPDFLHVYQFYPNSKKYLFLANEPVGEAPDLAHMKPADLQAYLKSIQASLGDIFKRSYFITGRMLSQIPRVKGVIPVFMVFMARTGCEVLNIEPIQLNPDGNSAKRNGPAKGGLEGVRITFRPEGKYDDIRTLEYFNCDVSDEGISAHPEIPQYVKSFGTANTFVKAASYLMHYGTFSKIREATMAISSAILEDDTGIPLRYLEAEYTPYLYGRYVPPVNEFKGVYQKDLAVLYKDTTHVKPLPFSLGYHWLTKDQNYMLYVKKK